MSDVRVKICGIKTEAALKAACDAGAAYVGFVFFPKSPRNVSVAEAAALAVETPIGVAKVALVVDPDDALLDEITRQVPLDFIQLHGAETPERVAEVRARYGLPVMKAIGIAGPEDVAKIDLYAAVADQLLIDTKAPKDAALPGGNGQTFDWTLARRKYWTKPWMLAGGLTAENVAQAIAVTGSRQVDLSSAVESAPGVKDPAKIRAFMDAVRAA